MYCIVQKHYFKNASCGISMSCASITVHIMYTYTSTQIVLRWQTHTDRSSDLYVKWTRSLWESERALRACTVSGKMADKTPGGAQKANSKVFHDFSTSYQYVKADLSCLWQEKRNNVVFDSVVCRALIRKRSIELLGCDANTLAV